jgi:adenylate cyclase
LEPDSRLVSRRQKNTFSTASCHRFATQLSSSCGAQLRQLCSIHISGRILGGGFLSGHVERGDIETLEAALMFCDLRGFTDLSNRVSDQRILELLNTYFDQVVPAITEHSGEILKFIRDGVLAIFRNSAAPGESCRAAFDAARAAQQRLRAIILVDAELRAGIALHYGNASYGNIGSRDRLDFTVIGPDVNLTSRIEGMCDALGHSLLMSERFAKLLSRPDIIDVGSHRLKGFPGPIQLFARDDQ